MPNPARTPDKALAAVLKAVRKERGLSQEATAQRAGITMNSYARIELGQAAASWSTVRAIAKALDVSLVDLAARVERKR